jgi:hypothetical protein
MEPRLRDSSFWDVIRDSGYEPQSEEFAPRTDESPEPELCGTDPAPEPDDNEP